MRTANHLPGGTRSSVLWRYYIATLAVVVAVAGRLSVEPVIGPGAVLCAFVLAILATARVAGRGPALLCSALSVLAADYFFLAPHFSFTLGNGRDLGTLMVLALCGAGISLATGPSPQWSRALAEKHSANVTLRRTVLPGSGLVVLLVLTRLFYVDFVLDKEREQFQARSYRLLDATGALLSTLQDAETGERGYLLTGSDSYREPFDSGSRKQEDERRMLRQLTASNPGQREAMAKLDVLVEAKFKELRETMQLRQSAGLEAALAKVSTGEGKRIMDECRATIRGMEENDSRWLALQLQSTGVRDMRLRWLLGLGSASLLLLLVIAAAVIERDRRNSERAHEQVVRSEMRLRMALDAAGAGAWERELETGVNTWSEELWRLLGIEPGSREPTFENWREMLHPDDRESVSETVQQAFRNGTELNVEYRVRGRSGTERWLMSRGRPLRNAWGRTTHILGIALDITHRKQAEEALRQSEENLRHFAEFAPVSIAMFDCEMRYLAASRRFREDYALGSQELLGRSHYEVFPEIPGTWREVHRRCLAGATERSDGERFLRTDGTEQWIRWEIQPWHLPGGDIGGIVLFSEETTLQKQSELALRESEDQFRTLANAIPQLCWMADNDAKIFWFNQRWYEYTGSTPEQSVGAGWQEFADPAAVPEVMHRAAVSIANGAPFDMVYALRGADGVFRPFLTRVMPVRDHDGRVVRWFGTNTDVSEQQSAQEALRNAFQQRQLALDAAELGAWEFRFDTGEVHWDDACRNMFGFPAGSTIAYGDAISRIHPDEVHATDAAVQRAIAGENGGAYHHEFRVVWEDGSVHWIASHGRVQFEDPGGRPRPVNLAGVSLDITGRKQAELEIQQLNAQLEQRVRQRTAQLEAANQELEAFAHSVSHDLRAPLRGIDGWSLALSQDYAGQLDARGLRYLERVRSETQRMGLLIDDMLMLSRVTRTPMRVNPVDLAAAARGIADGLAEAHADRRIEFVIEPCLMTSGDARLLDIVLTNLLTNAVKFTAPRSRAVIEFGQVPYNGSRAFYVRDNGVGYDPAYTDRLFRAFQRLHRASDFPGTGIGLATVQRVIHRHAGRVWGEGAIDRGATFYFTIGEIA